MLVFTSSKHRAEKDSGQSTAHGEGESWLAVEKVLGERDELLQQFHGDTPCDETGLRESQQQYFRPAEVRIPNPPCVSRGGVTTESHYTLRCTAVKTFSARGRASQKKSWIELRKIFLASQRLFHALQRQAIDDV